ncbi:crotonase/enoyl-CoA hydratase family protein [Veronia pacifica]|uniref:Enoyl-CoA hydratase n=1 Tax=Veronia pacifica TaxID=1080227 RepID=A0A1C3EPN5_9GAMM|nr:crotonase/enoyl-CoA hydratase family protein [Veronia pacifica]ODA35221.1 enoyl-CoA hydratase [Veronia pacifica]
MEWKYLQLNIENSVADVRLNRPEKFNAMNYELFCEIDSVQKYLKKQRDVRVVILSGAGNNFSSGIDIHSMMDKTINFFKVGFKWLPWQANMAQRVCIGWQRMPIPVIAAIEGVCFGAAMNVALGCDMRYASPDAKLGIMEVRWGMVPDMAGMDSLRGLVSKDVALELIHTGMEIPAQQAKEIGLVTRVTVDPLAEARKMADKIAERSPDATAAIKLSTHKSWNASTKMLLARETIYQMAIIISKNWRIAIARNRKEPDRQYAPRQWWW